MAYLIHPGNALKFNTMKLILVFDGNGDLLKQIQYKTKRQARMNFNGFKKYGMLDPETGLVAPGLRFELI